MTTAKLNSIVQSMAKQRPFFYSEADFQHSLALALKANGYEVFLEYPVRINNNSFHIDIIMRNEEGLLYPIELKYKTKSLACPGLLGPHKLRTHSAHDINRFLFWKDVDRLEQLKLVTNGKISKGFVIMLTNDEKYWLSPKTLAPIDGLFRIHPNITVQHVNWTGQQCVNNDYKAGNVIYKHFCLNAPYTVPQWEMYSSLNDSVTHKPHEFKFLTISV